MAQTPKIDKSKTKRLKSASQDLKRKNIAVDADFDNPDKQQDFQKSQALVIQTQSEVLESQVDLLNSLSKKIEMLENFAKSLNEFKNLATKDIALRKKQKSITQGKIDKRKSQFDLLGMIGGETPLLEELKKQARVQLNKSKVGKKVLSTADFVGNVKDKGLIKATRQSLIEKKYQDRLETVDKIIEKREKEIKQANLLNLGNKVEKEKAEKAKKEQAKKTTKDIEKSVQTAIEDAEIVTEETLEKTETKVIETVTTTSTELKEILNDNTKVLSKVSDILTEMEERARRKEREEKTKIDFKSKTDPKLTKNDAAKFATKKQAGKGLLDSLLDDDSCGSDIDIDIDTDDNDRDCSRIKNKRQRLACFKKQRSRRANRSQKPINRQTNSRPSSSNASKPATPKKSVLSSAGSKLSKLKGGIGGLVGGLALDYGANKAKESGYEKVGAGLSVASSAATYAGLGAMAGSVVPGLGNLVGAGVGGLVGTGIGLYDNWETLSDKQKAKGFSKGGFTGSGDPSKPAGVVHKNEFVINSKTIESLKTASSPAQRQKILAKATSPLLKPESLGKGHIVGTKKPTGLASATKTTSTASGGFLGSIGSSFKEIASSVGGFVSEKINDVENAGKNAFQIAKNFASSPEDVKKAIKEASKKSGVSEDILVKIAKIESNFNPNARAKTSTAGGLFQFLDSTWATMMKGYASSYGLTGNESKFDPLASAYMGAQYVKDNMAGLSKVKSDVNATDVYMAHFMGLGGARSFLKAMQENPTASGAQLFPSQAKANKSIFYTGNGGEQTLRAIYSNFATKLGENIPLSKIGGSPKTTTSAPVKSGSLASEGVSKGQLKRDSKSKTLNAKSNKKAKESSGGYKGGSVGGVSSSGSSPSTGGFFSGASSFFSNIGSSIGSTASSLGSSVSGAVSVAKEKIAAFLGQGFKTQGGVDYQGMNPQFKKNFELMAAEYKAATGKNILITSGYRSIEKQAELYNSMPPGMAAKPGSSLHNFGWAMDINTTNANELASMGLLDKYGFHRPLLASKGETWHIEPKGIDKNKIKQNPKAQQDIKKADAKVATKGGAMGKAPTSSKAMASEGVPKSELKKEKQTPKVEKSGSPQPKTSVPINSDTTSLASKTSAVTSKSSEGSGKSNNPVVINNGGSQPQKTASVKKDTTLLDSTLTKIINT